MKEQTTTSRRKYKGNRDWGKLLIPAATIVVVLLALFSNFIFERYIGELKSLSDAMSLKDQAAVLGQFGDFMGGLINPAVGIATTLLILITIVLQRQELKNSIEELRNSNEAISRQSFEQTFFSWLGSYRDLVGSATITGGQYSTERTGRNALSRWLDTYLSAYALEGAKTHTIANLAERLKNGPVLSDDDQLTVSEIARKQWEHVYSAGEDHIDSMFRTLYRLIRWIDEQSIDLLDPELKWHYVSIIRAQLSIIEMQYLFFNGLTDRGRNFNKYINRYAIFDNLESERDVVIRLLQGLDATPYEPRAYNSELAKKVLVQELITEQEDRSTAASPLRRVK